MTDLNTSCACPGFLLNSVLRINDKGQVLGFGHDLTINHSMNFPLTMSGPPSVIDLDAAFAAAGWILQDISLNNSGAIGFASNVISNELHALLLAAGSSVTITDLGSLGVPGEEPTSGDVSNNLNEVAGELTTTDGSHGALWTRLGDVNGDGFATAVDALCVLRIVANLPSTTNCPIPPPGNPIVIAGETTPTAADALCISRGIVGLPATSNCPLIIRFGLNAIGY